MISLVHRHFVVMVLAYVCVCVFFSATRRRLIACVLLLLMHRPNHLSLGRTHIHKHTHTRCLSARHADIYHQLLLIILAGPKLTAASVRIAGVLCCASVRHRGLKRCACTHRSYDRVSVFDDQNITAQPGEYAARTDACV